jgi:hypothetical protein
MKLSTFSALVLLVGLAHTATAQTVYRCGPDGREYSQAPCAQGQAVDVSDPRSAEQQAAAQKRARDDEAAGRTMERERRAREAAAAPSQAGSFSRPVAATSAKSASPPARKKAKKKKHQDAEGDFKAVAPGSAKKAKSRN